MSYIKFYHIYPDGERLPIEQSTVNRSWMDETAQSYSYRCLPMTYANRHGWCVRLTEDVEVIWDGNSAASGTTIIKGHDQGGKRMVDNGTGNGIVTFHLNAIPRTSPEWNLWIVGAPNLVIPGASPLSGVLESDWMFTSPTMNWKITSPNTLITFKKGDPVIFFVPVHKTELESFTLSHHSLTDDPEMQRHYDEHNAWRKAKDAAGEAVFGKMYLRGKRSDGTVPDFPHNHKAKLNLHCPYTNTDKS